ncbi:MAG: SDR family NAD(P)-dependent oxidoreductase [Rhodospirillaceae bacterium]|nr:SDR family NAD(P)-dependent oxidoreductase [Rhodospirillaceae bacterium]
MKGQTVLISGAGIGIGRGIALAFAAESARVIVTDVLAAEGAGVSAEIAGKGGAAEFHPMDVTDTAQVNAVIADVERRHGPIATLVCNAGIAKKIPLPTMTDAAWDTTLDVDLKGMMRMIRAAAPDMRRARAGAIICLASVVGTAYGWNEHIPYSAAKAGVAGLVRGAAIELAKDGVRVNGIAPGFIRTAQTLDPVHSVGPAGLDAAAPTVPLGRIGEPSDIADVAVFLASPKARYITGQIITVDGGLLVGL